MLRNHGFCHLCSLVDVSITLNTQFQATLAHRPCFIALNPSKSIDVSLVRKDNTETEDLTCRSCNQALTWDGLPLAAFSLFLQLVVTYYSGLGRG
jgi:hypothetical protein